MGGPFSGCQYIVVAVSTSIGGLSMIKGQSGGAPGCITVARFTQITAHRMSGRLEGSGTYTIMASTTGTSSRGLTVIKRCNQRQEAGGYMTGVARITGQRVSRPFSLRCNTIMTTNTTVGRLAVVKR